MKIPDPIACSKFLVNIKDGLYTGLIGGANVKLTSQDAYGLSIQLNVGIKGMNIACIVLIKNRVAYCFTESISI